MPKAWSDKDERQYEHVKDSAKKRGRSTKRAKEIAARTVNKQRSEEGRTKKQNNGSAKGRGASSNGSRSSRSNGSRSARSNGSSRRGGNSLENRTVKELRKRASELAIQGRSKMKKDELVRAIRRRQ